jgi:hypothetical protein
MRGKEPGSEKWFSESLQRIAAKKRTNIRVVFLFRRQQSRQPCDEAAPELVLTACTTSSCQF